MRVYIAEHAIGSFAFNEQGELIDYVKNTEDVGKVVEALLNELKGEPLPSTVELISKIKVDEYVLENEEVSSGLSKLGVKILYEPNSIGAQTFRGELVQIALKTGFAESEEKLFEFINNVATELTRRKLRQAAENRDQLAVQAIRAIDDIDKTINLFSERLREWYSIHFPELDKLIEDHKLYSQIIRDFGERDNISEEKIAKLGIPDAKAKKIAEAAKRSLGANLSEDDLSSLKVMAENILSLFSLRDELTEYAESIMKEIAPNVTSLVGSSLAARLLSLAGSLKELAKMPASTIQVLGAEKALFRSLRSGTRPPKHGIIFQYPAIHNAPRWQRGKMARALATKLATAAKIDAYSGKYVGGILRQQLEKRIQEIRDKYPNPPPKKEIKEERKERKEKRRKRGRGR
ncbi:hypothetical protein HS7_20150 [Sulfolobales archaeon HS-7]|nr:hypothetical protein HS7_20150 [Sulfolobales archaeon HS-7]